MKKTLALFLVLTLLVSAFAGCAPKPTVVTPPTTPTPTPTAKPEALKAELTMWSMPLIEEFETFLQDKLFSGFNKDFPDVKINLEMMTWEGGPEKLQIALGTGTTPDIYLDGTARTASLPGKGVLADVSDVINEFKDKYYPSVMEIGKLDGKNYLVPVAAMNGCLFTVNSTLAKKLGTYDMLPKDKKSWSFDDYYKFVKACTEAGKAEGIYGVGLYAGSATSDIGYYSMMLSNRGKLLADDRKTSLGNSPENVEIVDLLGRIVKDGYSSPGAPTMKNEDTEPLFFSSKVVTTVDGNPFYYATTFKQMADSGQVPECPQIEAFGIPTKDGKSDMITATWGANTFAIFKNGDDADKISAAKELLKYYTKNTDIAAELCKLNGNSPAIQGVTVAQDDPNLQAMVPFATECTGNYAVSSFGVLEPYWAEMRSNFYPELQAVYSGKKTAQEALDTYKANVDAILAKQ